LKTVISSLVQKLIFVFPVSLDIFRIEQLTQAIGRCILNPKKNNQYKEVTMAEKGISVKIQPKKGSEAAFFAERDQKILRALREKATNESTGKYCEAHRYHCFRCGTKSLAEIDEGNVKIDICVNEDCGAVHLDPGELKKIIKDQGALSAAKNAFLSVFK
jgi:Transcription factor zinc-finger